MARRFAAIVRASAAPRRRPAPAGSTEDFAPQRLKLKHLSRLTDAGGIMRFGQETRPDPAG